MVLKETHCLGFNQNKTQTVREWIEHQDLADYCEHNDLLMDLISLKNQMQPKPLDLKSAHIFHLALYDLDSFRLQIFDNDLLDELELEQDKIAKIKTDDVALLKFGIAWVKRELFGQ
jgi:hypothetical protein